MRTLAAVTATLALAAVAACTSDPSSAVSATPDGASAGASLPALAVAIRGLVTYPDGALVPKALVSVTGLDGQAVPEIAVFTGEDGMYEWPTLTPGRYAVRVSVPGTASVGSTNVTVSGSQAATADVVVARS